MCHYSKLIYIPLNSIDMYTKCVEQHCSCVFTMATAILALKHRSWFNCGLLDPYTVGTFLCCYPCSLGVQWETINAPNKTVPDACIPRTPIGLCLCCFAPPVALCVQACLSDGLTHKLLGNRDRESQILSYFWWTLWSCVSCGTCVTIRASREERSNFG